MIIGAEGAIVCDMPPARESAEGAIVCDTPLHVGQVRLLVHDTTMHTSNHI